MPPTTAGRGASSGQATSTSGNGYTSDSSLALHWMDYWIRCLRRVNLVRSVFFAAIVALSALLIGGCTTNSLKSVYILSLSYPPASSGATPSEETNPLSAAFNAPISSDSLREVRVGYLGLCARTGSESWFCDAKPHDLMQALRDANQTDHLNLVWTGNQFRTEAISSILLYITVTCAFLCLCISILYPSSDDGMAPVLRRAVEASQRIFSSISHVACLSLFIAPTAFASLNFALWQHLSSAISTSMTDVLSFEGINCRTGPEATAIAWIIFALAIGSAASLLVEHRRKSSKPWVLETSLGATSTNNTNVAEDVEPQPELPEQPPEPAWQSQTPANYAFLLYLVGQRERDIERTMRQRTAATWVHQNHDRTNGASPGYAETIHD